MPAPETQITENMKDLAQIPRCVHYVCSENKCINNTLLIKTKRVGVSGGGGGGVGGLRCVIISIPKLV